jgi:hypothetical protein
MAILLLAVLLAVVAAAYVSFPYWTGGFGPDWDCAYPGILSS